MNKKRVLVLSLSPLERDPRVMRQIHFLKDECDLTVCGWGVSPSPEVEYICADDYRPGFLGKAFLLTMLALHIDYAFYWGFRRHRETLRRLDKLQCDIVVSNDLDALPISLKIARRCNARLIADLHEYFPGQSSGWMFSLLFAGHNLRMCKWLLPKVDICMTVCKGIADLYKEQTGVSVSVLTNAPEYENLVPSAVNPNHVRLVHHGVASPERKILELIEMMRGLEERFTLDLVLVADNDSAYMKQVTKSISGSGGRVRLLPPFSMQEIAKRVNEYDLGICMLETKALSKQFALPNKFFEWIQGRLGIVTWPLPEMKRLIELHKLGVVSSDFSIDSMQHAINSLTVEDIVLFKKNACSAAGLFNAEANRDLFRGYVFSDAATVK